MKGYLSTVPLTSNLHCLLSHSLPQIFACKLLTQTQYCVFKTTLYQKTKYLIKKHNIVKCLNICLQLYILVNYISVYLPKR